MRAISSPRDLALLGMHTRRVREALLDLCMGYGRRRATDPSRQKETLPCPFNLFYVQTL